MKFIDNCQLKQLNINRQTHSIFKDFHVSLILLPFTKHEPPLILRVNGLKLPCTVPFEMTLSVYIPSGE